MSKAKHLARRTIERLVAARGYRLVPRVADGEAGATTFFDETAPIPAALERTLRADNPRLAELKGAYAALDWPVTRHSHWHAQSLDTVDLRYFRGDSPYVWQYREQDHRTSALKYFVYLTYVLDRDRLSLVDKLGEDGAFGCHAYRFPGYPPCSRDLLESVTELQFLERHDSLLTKDHLKVLDIGAGYGRLAHRTAQAADDLVDFACVDAVPESTFLCEQYVVHRDVSPPVRVVALPDVPALEPGSFDVAFNVHSFSEMPRVAVEWWIEQIARLEVPKLFVVPNEPKEMLTKEWDGVTRLDYRRVIEDAGYRVVAEQDEFEDEAVRALHGVENRYYLFGR